MVGVQTDRAVGYQLPAVVDVTRGESRRGRYEIGAGAIDRVARTMYGSESKSGRPADTAYHATAARDDINTSVGIGRRNRQVIAIGRFPS